MKRQQPERASRQVPGCAAKEFIGSRSERQRTLFHVFAQLVPGLESVFARNYRLRVVQGEICGA